METHFNIKICYLGVIVIRGNCLGWSVNKFNHFMAMYLHVHVGGFIYFNVTTLTAFMPSKTNSLIYFYGNIFTLKYVIWS